MRAAALAALLALPVRAENAHPELKQGESQARQAVEPYRRLERLRKDLRYMSEELDRERVGGAETLKAFSQGGLERLDELRKRGYIDPKLAPAIDALRSMYQEMPRKTYAEQYARGLSKSIGHELRWISEEAQSEPELLGLLESHLTLPDQRPGDEDAFSSLARFPEDLPVAQFKKLGPIRVFLLKHRMRRPKTPLKTTAQAVAAGRHNCQIGVEVEGRVTSSGGNIDGDYSFNIGDLHIELTPEWFLLNPRIPLPKKGQRVRVRGWTYFDMFHMAEQEYHPDDPVIGTSRRSLWEIHPVLDIERLPN